MATTQRRSTSDASSAPAPFSYAQAAKGIATSATPASNVSKPASGSVTPAKDTPQIPNVLSQTPSNTNWAEDAEMESVSATKESEKLAPERGSLPDGSLASNFKGDLSQQANGTSVISSPDFGTASSSTLGKDDDVASLPNASSESTWEDKSQTSNIEKKDSVQEKDNEKYNEKDHEKEKAPPPKPLQDAPIPVVNIWKRRAQDFAKSRPTIPSSTGKKMDSPAQTKTNDETARRGRSDESQLPVAPGKDRRQNFDGRRLKDDDYPLSGRRDTRLEGEPKRRNVGRGRDVQNAPLPPTRDQESWPTPESAQDEEKRRSIEKGEKGERERSVAPTVRPHGKSDWVPVPFTPSVVFNTQMPGPNGRRGGRPGGRGGNQAGGRGGPYPSGVNVVSNDKDNHLPNGDSAKRVKADGITKREESPPKPRPTNHSGSAPWKDQRPLHVTERSQKPVEAQSDNQEARKAVAEDTPQPQGYVQAPGLRGPPNRQKPGRKPDMAGASDRRRDSEVISPNRDNAAASYNRRVPSATQNEGTTHRRTKPALPARDTNPRTEPNATDRKPGTTVDGHGPKSAGPERRNGPYGTYPGREREPRGRGGMRNGRGNHNTYNNAHANGQPYVNGNSATQQPTSSFGNPKSPTPFYPDQSGGYFPSSQRSYGRNGTRSQSVSTEAMYGHQPNGYTPTGQNLPSNQAYGPYDYQMMQSMGAMPWTSFIPAPEQLLSVIVQQIEYYFSLDNLLKDMFLRKHMDSKGFVLLSVIADFNRVKQLTTDIELIKMACSRSQGIEWRVGSDGKDRLRRSDRWEKFVLARELREPSAQNEGPDDLHYPPIPHVQGFTPTAFDPYTPYPMGLVSGPASPSRHDPSFAAMNAVGINGTIANGPPSKPDTFTYSGNPSEGATMYPGPNGLPGNPEADSFSDQQVEALSVIVRKQDPTASSQPANTRTFSNGSLDSRQPSDEPPTADAQHNEAQLNGHVPSQGNERTETPDVEFPLELAHDDNRPTSYPVKLFWVKDKETPVEQLPKESTCELYTQVRSKALDQRQAAAPGVCPYNMDILYQFWSHFLVRNFNTHMYDEFRHLAFVDLHQRMSDIGMTNLTKYYGETLTSQSTIRLRIARHIVDLIKSEPSDGDRPVFHHLKSAWKSNSFLVQNREKITQFLDDELKITLEE